MQLDKLYTTSGTTNYDFDLTAAFMSLPEDFKDDMGDQYLMGYCDTEHMPACCTPVYFNQTAEELSFLADYSRNYGFGFARWTYDGGAAPGNLYYIDGDDNIVRSWGINYDFDFINRGEMCRVNTNPAVEIFVEAIYIRADLYDGVKCTRLLNGGTEAGTINNLGGVWLSFTFTDFVNMIKNDTPIIDGTYSGSGQSFNITVRPSDFGDGFDPDSPHYVTWDAGNGFYVFFAIEGVRMGGNTPVYYNGTSYPANIVPFFTIPHNTSKKSIIAPGSFIQGCVRFNYSNGAFTAIQNGGSFGYNQATEFVNNVVYGGFNNGVLSVNDIDWSEATLSGQRRNVFFVRNFYGIFLGAGEFRFYSLYTPRDIYNYLCLYHKHTATPSDNYSAADTVTVFTAQDMPTFDTVSGTLSEIGIRLRPWQIPGIDIKSNTFTPEDIPEPTPEPGDDEESGDTIDFVMRSFSGASNFITNYAMTRYHVGVFGNRLWTSWADSLGNPTEMIKNIRIFYTGGDTGSIDIGSVMPFIVSMKIFPFDLSNFIGYETNGIKIGTGHYPIEVPGCWYLPRSSVYVSCGTVTIPRIFNDFRDYENMNIMCYVPYCGTVELNPGDVIGRTLSCTYGVDLQSGGCTAYIIVDNNYPVATISGQMGSSVPLTATNSGQLMSQRLSDISGASALIGNTTMQVQRESERPHPKQANMDSAIVGAVLQAADSVPQRFRRSAISCPTMSAGNGLDAFAQPPTPYIQMRYGIYDLPANYKHSIGRISTKSNKLSEYKDTGFITCSNVDTSPLTCHNDEKAAIKAALESGVYI